MSDIDRFTTAYDAREDRIRILVALSSGDTQKLWLTRRLLDRLVQALVKKLETVVSENNTIVSVSSKGVVQRFTQAAAIDAFEKQKPVTSSSDEDTQASTALLVTQIGLRWSRMRIEVDLKVDDELSQTLVFNEKTLRQWMGIVHSQYKIAKWPDEIWPSWMQLQPDSGAIARLN